MAEVIQSATVRDPYTRITQNFCVGKNDVVMIDNVVSNVSSDGIAIWVQPDPNQRYYRSCEFSREVVLAIQYKEIS